jgi:putative flippase GtrA
MSTWRRETGYLGRYLGTGGLNTIVGFAVIFGLLWAGASPLLANVAGYGVGLMLGFLFSRKFVFRSEGHWTGEGVRYLLAFALAFMVNLLVLRELLGRTELHVMAAQIVASAAYTLLMYALSRIFIFRELRNSKG